MTATTGHNHHDLGHGDEHDSDHGWARTANGHTNMGSAPTPTAVT